MLKATPRKPGTRQAKKLRLQGKIPVSIQGEGKPHADLAIDEAIFMAARRHHEHLFDVEVEGGDNELVLVRELQWDTTVERILHVEFRRVVRGQKTEVEVTLHFEGVPKGGVTNQMESSIMLLALPSEIPDGIVVKMGEFEPGHTVHAGDLTLPEGVELATDPDLQLASVTAPRGEEEEETDEDEPTEPELIKPEPPQE